MARASSERLIDTLAGAAMSQRLMALQRRQIMENQVLDRRTRRALHDDVLPRLHAAMLALAGSNTRSDGASQQALECLATAHRQISDLLREMPAMAAPEVARLGLIGALRRVVENEFAGSFDKVSWQIDPSTEKQTALLSPLVGEVIFYAAREAIRNAARYGRGIPQSPIVPANGEGKSNQMVDIPLHLSVTLVGDEELLLQVEDSGVGTNIVSSNRSGQNGGSGQGLALHSTMMAVIGGSLEVESAPEHGTRVILTLPRKLPQN